MRVTSLGYRTDLGVLRADGSQIIDNGDHVVVRTPRNPGYWWGNFLLLAGAPQAGELDGWLARFSAEFPAARHRTFGIDLADVAQVDQSVFTSAGFLGHRDTVLTASAIREPARPNTTAVFRPLSGDDDWRQAADLREACSATEVPAQAAPSGQDFAALRTLSRRRLTEASRAVWFGAFADGRLVAQLGVVPAPGGLARYQDVETQPGFRRQGLAGTLVWHAGRHAFDEFGSGTLVIVADPDYQAIRIYESVGFARTQEQIGFERAP